MHMQLLRLRKNDIPIIIEALKGFEEIISDISQGSGEEGKFVHKKM